MAELLFGFGTVDDDDVCEWCDSVRFSVCEWRDLRETHVTRCVSSELVVGSEEACDGLPYNKILYFHGIKFDTFEGGGRNAAGSK